MLERGVCELAHSFFHWKLSIVNVDRYKAAYLNEAGRMHAMSQEMVSAAKFFRLATDAALSKHKHSRHAPEIEGQALMLLASLNDQG